MNILIVLSPADFVVVLPEVYVRILLNIFYFISNDILKCQVSIKQWVALNDMHCY